MQFERIFKYHEEQTIIKRTNKLNTVLILQSIESAQRKVGIYMCMVMYMYWIRY